MGFFYGIDNCVFLLIMKKLDHYPRAKDFLATHQAIKPYIHQTPIFSSSSINKLVEAELYFKCENMQRTGSFKMRGAISAALACQDKQLKKGLATHSSGNHAQAVALAASLLNTKANIVMPTNAPAVKVEAVRTYGGDITFCEPTLEARENSLRSVVEKTASNFIHPYDNYNVICGQGTATLEILRTVPNPYAIIAPVGGGGLMSGTALVSKHFSPDTLVWGAEPKAVDDAFRSIKAKRICLNKTTETIADGLKTILCEKTFNIICKYVDEIFPVTEEEIKHALHLIWQRLKLVVEPSSAVPLAAMLKNKDQINGKRIIIILSGGNVDLTINAPSV